MLRCFGCCWFVGGVLVVLVVLFVLCLLLFDYGLGGVDYVMVVGE